MDRRGLLFGKRSVLGFRALDAYARAVIGNPVVFQQRVDLFAGMKPAFFDPRTRSSLRNPRVLVAEVHLPKGVTGTLPWSGIVDLTADPLLPKNAILISLLAQHQPTTPRSLYILSAKCVGFTVDQAGDRLDLMVGDPDIARSPATPSALGLLEAQTFGVPGALIVFAHRVSNFDPCSVAD